MADARACPLQRPQVDILLVRPMSQIVKHLDINFIPDGMDRGVGEAGIEA
jgi:hypothetical protein